MLRWLGLVLSMGYERIPKSLLYSKFVVGKRNRGRPKIRFKYVYERDLNKLKYKN